jgi:hypothetical protein
MMLGVMTACLGCGWRTIIYAGIIFMEYRAGMWMDEQFDGGTAMVIRVTLGAGVA